MTDTTASSPAIMPAGDHTQRMWDTTAAIRERIDRLPFLHELGEGTLDPERFAFYISQDAQYLVAYQKAMTTLAGRAPRSSELKFWAKSAVGAVAEEQAMHRELQEDPRLKEYLADGLGPRSLATAAYSEFLIATGATESYAVACAAVLPCYWIYAEAGVRVGQAAGWTQETGAPTDHPYSTWVGAYADQRFHTIAEHAVRITERACAEAGDAERDRAVEAFRAATRFEELFWEQAQVPPAQRILI